MRRCVLALTLVITALYAEGTSAEGVPSVVPGFGVDTTAVTAWANENWHRPVPEIFRAWRTYLLTDARTHAPTTLWSAAEQRRWSAYDLTAGFAYQGFPATVLDILPSRPGATDEYVVRTLFAKAIGDAQEVKPLAVTRVYAVREAGRWVFSNALPHVTRDWRRAKVGPITYVVEPGHHFDLARAGRAARFVDSVATAFGAPPVDSLTYVVTETREAANRVMGLDWTVGGTGYAWANSTDRIIFAGDPSLGEEYRHELVHFALGPLTAAGRTHGLVNEGVATWLGGSMGHDFPSLMREYASFLERRPDVTLDAILEDNDPDKGWNPAGAALTLLVYEHGGVEAVKALMQSGRGTAELKTSVASLLGMPWSDVAVRWRERILAFG